MPRKAALARGRFPRLLASSSLAALLIGGGAPVALACTIDQNSGGTVPPVTNSSAIDCIVISNGTTVAGDVTNTSSGHITATGATRPTGTGITITNASVTGAVSNQGTITASTGVGIRIDNGALVSGGIGNSGTITASGNAIRVGGTATGTGTLTISTFAGGISNSGTISSGSDAISVTVNASGSAAVAAISTFSGGITNSGTITAARDGIRVSSRHFPSRSRCSWGISAIAARFRPVAPPLRSTGCRPSRAGSSTAER